MSGVRRYISIVVLVVLAACTPAERSADTPPAADTPALPATESASAPVASLKGYDVVVAVVDGLRADRALDSDTAPFISDLAAHGINFTDTVAASSHVLQSLAALSTGRLPTNGGTIGVYEAEPHDETTTLAQHFQQAGYYTGLLANHPAVQGKGFTRGFEEVQVARAGQPLDDAALVKRATEFLEDAGDDSIFLYVHLAGPLASKLYHPEADATGPISLREIGQDPARASDAARAEATIAEYDNAVRAADAQLRALADALNAAGRAEKTLLVVTSLHGFELFEHGYLGAGWTLYDESVRVPLVLHAPGVLDAQVTNVPASGVDVLPTVLALLELGELPPNLDGMPLLAPGTPVNAGRQRIAELVIPERCIVRRVQEGEWTYIASSLWAELADRLALAEAHRDTANAQLSGERPMPPLWGVGAREILFKAGAEVVLADNEQARAALSMMLEDYRARCEQSGIAPRVASQSVSAVDPETIQNLESLGYL